jgi:hypothetical protein
MEPIVNADFPKLSRNPWRKPPKKTTRTSLFTNSPHAANKHLKDSKVFSLSSKRLERKVSRMQLQTFVCGTQFDRSVE